ncbi:MAG: iron ABC transporter permease [Coriobacteriales bacterium]|nr:iron ABC transporter permease [Coriobacteriales bacterium]
MANGAHDARRARVLVAFAVLLVLLVALLVANLCVGSVPISPGELAQALANPASTHTAAQVVWHIRLPRLLAAGLLGGALGLAGLLLQTLFANPIAGPFVLGISSGAKLCVAILLVGAAGTLGVLSAWMTMAAAFVGALGAMVLVLLVSARTRSASVLVVAGVMIGYLCNAATDLLITFASDANIVNLRNWSLGSFSGTAWGEVGVMALVVACGLACALVLAKPMGAYVLGEAYAQSVGVDVRRFRVATILLSSLLAACVTAFAGPISFVGIAVPHLAKRLLSTARPLVLVPATFLAGSVFCLACDLVARNAFAPTEVSVSTITALVGAPVVVWVLLRRERGDAV